VFEHYDHSLVIGDVVGGERFDREPLVYMARSFDWRLEPRG
jgi:hypothetical protein